MPEGGREIAPVPTVRLRRETNQLVGASRSTYRQLEKLRDAHPELASDQYLDDFLTYFRSFGANKPSQYALEAVQDKSGGYTIPIDLQHDILQRRAAFSVILGLGAEVIGATSDIAKWVRILEHPTDGSIYTSSFVGDWVSETPGASDGEADAQFGTLEIRIRKARALTKPSRDLVSDYPGDFLEKLTVDAAKNLALIVDKGLLAGTGIANQPFGILSDADIATVSLEGTTVNTISNTTGDLGSAGKLIDIVSELPSQYLDGAAWVMHRKTAAKIRKLVDAQNRYLWAAGLESNPPTLLGYPVFLSDFMPQDGTDGNKVAIFGNFSAGYVVAERMPLSAQVLVEKYSDTEQFGLIVRTRVGGGICNTDAFRFGTV